MRDVQLSQRAVQGFSWTRASWRSFLQLHRLALQFTAPHSEGRNLTLTFAVFLTSVSQAPCIPQGPPNQKKILLSIQCCQLQTPLQLVSLSQTLTINPSPPPPLEFAQKRRPGPSKAKPASRICKQRGLTRKTWIFLGVNKQLIGRKGGEMNPRLS